MPIDNKDGTFRLTTEEAREYCEYIRTQGIDSKYHALLILLKDIRDNWAKSFEEFKIQKYRDSVQTKLDAINELIDIMEKTL